MRNDSYEELGDPVSKVRYNVASLMSRCIAVVGAARLPSLIVLRVSLNRIIHDGGSSFAAFTNLLLSRNYANVSLPSLVNRSVFNLRQSSPKRLV